jgi:hypothetical protein
MRADGNARTAYNLAIRAPINANNMLIINPLNGTDFTTADVLINCSGTTRVGLVVKAISGQAVSLQEWWDAADSRRAHFDSGGNLVLQQKIQQRYRAPTINTNYSVAVNADYFVKFTTQASGWTNTATNGTITLPSAATAGAGSAYIIKDSGTAATRNLSVTGTGGQTIDGAASVTMNTNYQTLRVISDGSNWLTW